MNKKTATLILLLAAAAALAGCKGGNGKGFDPDQNSVYVADDGTVLSGMVYDMSQSESEYKEEDLKAFVEEIVIGYNTSIGAEGLARNPEGGRPLPVSLVSCDMKDKTGKVIFQYATPGDMLAFLETDEKDDVNRLEKLAVEKTTTVETVSGMTLYQIPDMTKTAWEDINKQGLRHVLVKGRGRIQLAAKPLYLGIGESTTAKMAGDKVLELEQGTACLLFK